MPRKLISLAAALLASAGIATAAAPAVAHDSGAVAARHGGDRDERPISTTERRKAAAAARKAVGGGNVTRVKREDDGRVRWEVKVRRGSREWEGPARPPLQGRQHRAHRPSGLGRRLVR